MIYFAAEEIYSSILHSIIFGILFAVGISLADCVIVLIQALPKYFSSIVECEKFSSFPKRQVSGCKVQKYGRIRIFFYIISFTLGYILLSYFSLDGVFRIYMLTLSLASVIFVKMTVGRLILCVSERLLHIFISPIIIFVQIFVIIFRKMTTKNSRKTK